MKDAAEFQGSIIVGEGVSVKGSFKVPNRAVINGSLEGELDADELLIGKGGKLVGAVRVKRADVHGETHHSLHASEHLVVRGTGRIHGKATYGLIEIERGGLIHGEVASLTMHPGNTPADLDVSTHAKQPDEPEQALSADEGQPQDPLTEGA